MPSQAINKYQTQPLPQEISCTFNDSDLLGDNKDAMRQQFKFWLGVKGAAFATRFNRQAANSAGKEIVLDFRGKDLILEPRSKKLSVLEICVANPALPEDFSSPLTEDKIARLSFRQIYSDKGLELMVQEQKTALALRFLGLSEMLLRGAISIFNPHSITFKNVTRHGNAYLEKIVGKRFLRRLPQSSSADNVTFEVIRKND